MSDRRLNNAANRPHRPRTRSRLLRILPALLLLAAVPVLGQGSLTDLFARGEYAAARTQLRTDAAALDRPGERLLWELQLETNPAAALEKARDAAADRSLPGPVRIQAALLAARLELGRDRPGEALRSLLPLLDDDHASALPGETFLLAGIAYRALGHLQRAREMFATIRPDDPAFGRARYLLGLTSLEEGDPALALRYFDTAARDARPGDRPDLLAGRWQALRATGEHEAAEATREELLRDAPLSLAAATVRAPGETTAEPTAEAGAGADTAVVLPEDDADAGESAAQPAPGRHSVQLAAFGDRSLALAFVGRWRGELPDLRIDEVRDRRGQILYKVRTGRYPSDPAARDAARRIGERLGIETMAVDTAR
ncbi:MAG: SPOR domain-containing protein [Candidatus Krumholzibacteriia bacterium]